MLVSCPFRKHVTIHNPDFKYGDVRVVSNTTRVIHDKCFVNLEPNETRTVFIQALFERNTTCEWRKTKSFKSGFNVAATVKVPKIPLTVKLGTSFSISLDNTTGEKEYNSELLHDAQEISVSPETTVCAKWAETVLEIEVPWTADVVFSGHVAVWFREKVNDHWLWFYPVEMLLDVEPRLKVVENGVAFETAGTFVGFGGTELKIRVRQLPASDAPSTAMQLVGPMTVYGQDAPNSSDESEEDD
ncbi:unnamed protein product [Ixodes hexagonus]